MGEKFQTTDQKLAEIDATIERIIRELNDYLDADKPDKA